MKIILVIALIFLLQLGVRAQSLTIRGIVTSAVDNSTIGGATVKLVKSLATTLTRSDGSFVIISAKESDTLIITHLNYQAEIIVTGYHLLMPIAVKLQLKARQLEEVIINTGYQHIPKERSTGSFENINTALF